MADHPSSMTGKVKKRGLHRPKTPLSFLVNSGNTAGGDAISTSPSTGSAQSSSLEDSILLFDLIVRRNKNQHRNQLFFRDICMLKSCLKRVSSTRQTLNRLSKESNAGKASTEVRQKLEREASLRSQKDVLEEHVREILVPRCYVSFSGLITDSQFANLGVVLLALLSSIVSGKQGVGVPQRSDRLDTTFTQTRKVAESVSVSIRSVTVTGEDQGQIIDRVYGSGNGMVAEVSATLHEDVPDEGVPVTRAELTTVINDAERGKPSTHDDSISKDSGSIEKKRTVPTAKKRKKKGNAIDDLFDGLM